MSRININDLLPSFPHTEGKVTSKKDEVSLSFLVDIEQAIAHYNMNNSRKSSLYYKPSSLGCLRLMYYMRRGANEDTIEPDYQGIGMADTGTRRHEAIQEVLESMERMGFEWKYVDVDEYLKQKHLDGKILDTQVTSKRGHETHLINNKYHVSCMCDGILQNIKTGNYYLFEFKNQISFKACKHSIEIDPSHMEQITAYATLLDLTDVIMLYENRDTCELYCPNVVHITPSMKSSILQQFIDAEYHVRTKTLPQARKCNMCKWCKYITLCKLEKNDDEIYRNRPREERGNGSNKLF